MAEPMDWKAKIKEKLLEHLVAAVLALIVLLLSIIWLAVPSEVWGKASEAIPKRVLWALAGLELIAIGLLTASLVDLKRHTRKPQSESELLIQYGLLWDSDVNPHCPVDKTMLIFHSYEGATTRRAEGHTLYCPACKEKFPIWDAYLGHMTILAAQNFVRDELDLRRIKNKFQNSD